VTARGLVDCHNDTPVLMLLRQAELGPQGNPSWFSDEWVRQAEAAGLAAQVLPLYAGPSPREAGLRSVLHQLALVREAVAAEERTTLVVAGEELDRARAEGRIAIVLALEGLGYLGPDVWLVDLLAELGVRMASLTHWGRNDLADGTADEPAGGRLSAAGVAAVGRLREHGILLDVSHLAPACVDHVLELGDAPLVASHSGARAVFDHHRNLSDRHLRAIAASGGVACAIFLPPILDPTQPTIDRVVDHLAHMAEVAGVDHVGIGSDFVGDVFDELYPKYDRFVMFDEADVKARVPGLERTADLPVLAEALERRGFSEEEAAAVMGGNLLRLFRERLG
jgi:membrane dipeptidase